jgi:hypothetical protein
MDFSRRPHQSAISREGDAPGENGFSRMTVFGRMTVARNRLPPQIADRFKRKGRGTRKAR